MISVFSRIQFAVITAVTANIKKTELEKESGRHRERDSERARERERDGKRATKAVLRSTSS